IWKVFFLIIGLSESILWRRNSVKFDRNSTRFDIAYFKDKSEEFSKKYTNYAQSGTYPFSSNKFIVNSFSFTDMAREYSFSKLYWNQILKIEPRIEKSEMTVYGVNLFISKTVSPKDDYFLWVLRNASIFPTTLQRCENMKSVFYLPKVLKEKLGDYLPVFDVDTEIPSSWLRYLDFKTYLNIDHYLKVLTLVSRDVNNPKDNSKKIRDVISFIYDKLYENFREGYERELASWGMSNKILVKSGKEFLPASSLSVLKVEGFKANNFAYYSSEKHIGVLRQFGVKVIEESDCFANIPNEKIKVEEIKQRVFNALPLITTAYFVKNQKEEWEEEYQRIYDCLKGLTFYKITTIQISYGNEDDVIERSSYYSDNSFYFVGNWWKARVLDGLKNQLAEILGVKSISDLLHVLILESFEEGLAFLKEKFGKHIEEFIPSLFRDPISTQSIGVSQENPVYNQNHEDIGREGEMYVYSELKQIYSKKYKSVPVDTTTGFTIEGYVNVVWQNISENTSCDHDFKVEENEKVIYIDSKATVYSDQEVKHPFFVSYNEFALMEGAEIYLIARVNEVRSEKPQLRFIKMNTVELAEVGFCE
ncbi:MAG: hypothetical protein ACEPOW_12985, partial [Bacteroidales bacterium]